MRASITTLNARLDALSFPARAGLLERASPALVNELESKIGAIPRALRAFWLHVGGVELMDFSTYAHVDWFRARHIEGPSDPLVVAALTPDFVEFLVDMHENDPEMSIALAPDDLHKDNISGGEPYGVALGDSADDPVFDDGSGRGLLAYIRHTVLVCGGFPGLEKEAAFDELREELTEGLPIF